MSASTSTVPPGVSSRAARSSSRAGSPPMPMLPSASSTCDQPPSVGSGANRSWQSIVTLRRWQCKAAIARLVDAEHRDPPLGERGDQPSGTATEVDGRARTSVEQPGVVAGGRRAPARDLQVHLGAVAEQQPRRPAGQCERRRRARWSSPRSRGDPRPEHARPARRPPRRTARPAPAATPSTASAAVSTSVRSGAVATRRPDVRSASAVQVAGVRSATSARRRGRAAASGSVQAQHPPSAVRGRAEYRVRGARERLEAVAQQLGGDLRGVHADLHGGQARVQRGGVGVRGGDPLAQPVAPLFDDVAPRRARPAAPRQPVAAARSPVSATTVRAPGTARAASRLSSRAADATRAACSGVAGGHSRVFTRPGTGAFASTITHGPTGRSSQQPGHVAGGAHRALDRAGHLGPPAGAACVGDRAARRSASPRHRP